MEFGLSGKAFPDVLGPVSVGRNPRGLLEIRSGSSKLSWHDVIWVPRAERDNL